MSFLQVGENPEPKINLPSSMSRCGDLLELISKIYPGIESISKPTPEYLNERTILSPRNDEVAEINKMVLDMYKGKSHTFLAADKQEQMNGNEASAGATYTSEILNQQNPSGLPPFQLDLKVGCPVMLLHNLSPTSGLCNGTRLRVEICEPHVIVATILTGDKAGNVVFIPRISLTPSSSNVIRMTRRQFPIRLAYAMTINKSQGQSVTHVGVDLRSPVFSHGQLYVALSRCTTAGRIHVLLPKTCTAHETTNVVYPEVLL